MGLKFANKGSVDKPKIELVIYYRNKLAKRFIDSLAQEVRYKYNLDLGLTDFYTKFKNNKVLAPVIKRWRGTRPDHQGSLYEYLIVGIVLQNATVKRSVNMLQTLLENYGTLLEYDGKKLKKMI